MPKMKAISFLIPAVFTTKPTENLALASRCVSVHYFTILKLHLCLVHLSVLPRAANIISAHLFSGWQISLISWGFHWTNHRKGVYFLFLFQKGAGIWLCLVEGTWTWCIWFGYSIDLNSWGMARHFAGSWMEKQILMKSGLSSCNFCCVSLVGPGSK